MGYNMDSHITSVEDVEVFFEHLLNERKVSFHPDDDFSDYINYTTKEPTFTQEEVAIYNKLMDEAFDVCERTNTDIYGIGLDSMNFHNL